ncbi:uncharacterized protein FIBRA_05351 [Fibroporia radiculosa]|uniref:Cysteine-rich protein 1 n=1 Tax=Fibroporia radiculosa TaxID=599839 RepID=J4IAN6_9APHY|nr:uncharacterized protein FIBRA_05351 [Fibroporia radiculosa]CCM03226.1 predicted protein [Fibroporia radiculosa]
MHPFGGTPICPRCNKAKVIKIMGPGRKLYHKPCLTCTSCGKRLDSYNLVEHDQEPYCKNCHIKLFGTRDLRLANLPNRDEIFVSSISPPVSPNRAATFGRAASPPARASSNNAPPLPMRRHATGGGSIDKTPFMASSPAPPMLRPTRTLSPTRGSAPDRSRSIESALDEQDEVQDMNGGLNFQTNGLGTTSTHTGRGAGGLPRTVPLSPVRNRFNSDVTSDKDMPSEGESAAVPEPPAPVYPSDTGVPMYSSLVPTSTGTRYGMALSGGNASPMAPAMTGRQWGGGTPVCPKCGKTVFFAEQAKAIGKTYHKGCLRCTECNTHLDSTRLTERDGNPFCHRCYSKLYGPQGSGYALLGKAGS